MQKIAAKQVEGVVDLDNPQIIPARKQFEGGVGSGYGTTGHYPILNAGFLYWVIDPDGVPQEGDFRLGVSPNTRLLALQQMQSGIWVNLCLDGCSSTSTSGGTGGGGTSGCLVYGTMITLADGSQKAIEELEMGDLLKTVSIEGLDSETEDAWKTFATSNFNATQSTSTVVGIQKAQYSYYYLLNDSLKITFEHPLLTHRNGVYAFTRANDVLVGDQLFTENGQWVEITSKQRVEGTVNVVNINVESQDTYFANNILVHNLIDPAEEKI